MITWSQLVLAMSDHRESIPTPDGVFGVLGVLGVLGVFGVLGVLGVLGILGVF